MTEAEEEREKLRVDSEARDIIHDVNSLANKDELQKTRWVWEFLQNAKDTATDEGVDITFQLSNDKIIISHNGSPFETKHLIAILHKKSTKSLSGDDGTTGKYGTGFVTTHILSKKLSISGVHKNASGERKFSIEIDRTSANLEEKEALFQMKTSIKSTFDKINVIADLPVEEIDHYNHSFTYNLNITSKHYAEKGLDDLEKNAVFTLLINKGDNGRKKINSITIIRNGTSNQYKIESKACKINGLDFVSSGNNDGLLYKQVENLIFGIPVAESTNSYTLKSIENQAVLFKEFPLIGTENFNLPVFIQHVEFRPTEPRDGIVTKRDLDEKEEFTPDINRVCLIDFMKEYLLFLDMLVSSEVENLHYLVLSGLPTESKNYTGKEWYMKNIQKPLRDFLITKNIVSPIVGNKIKIVEAKFPMLKEVSANSFYNVLTGLLPSKVPNEESFLFLNNVINQEIENWPENISISLEQLLTDLPNFIDTSNGMPYDSLKVVYQYLQSINSNLGETFRIYPNEKNELKTRNEVRLYPAIDDEIKYVSKELGKDLDIEFLNRELTVNTPGIELFDLESFYKNLNNDVISKTSVESATEQHILAILHVNTLFKTDRAGKREAWLAMLKEILPDKIGEKKYISSDYENYYQPAELWTAKYICYLIQQEVTMSQFAEKYFENDLIAAYRWLNRFLKYVYDSREDIQNFLTKYHIVPTQQYLSRKENEVVIQFDGVFKPYTESLFKEDNPKYFDEDLKLIVSENCNCNPKEYLIDNRITDVDFRSTDVNLVTKHIDKLFEDAEIASKIAVGGKLHDVFNTVNSWFDKHSDASSYLKTFAAKRNFLYVISLGDGFSKHIKAMKDSGKSMEDISRLAEINLSFNEMKELERVVSELGTNELLKKAEEMILLRDQRIRWKQIGNTAENAFKKVFESLEMEIELSNPDIGKDFEILLKSDKFSIEIKNVIEGKENVRMSILQGRTAVQEKDNYALCVVTRPDDVSEITEEYFIKNSKFIKNIGYQIGNKIENWDSGLTNLFSSDEVKVQLDEKKETIYVNRNIWKNGDSFEDFMIDLKKYFKYETH